MELTKQVTSLELSKRLKELGVKQESYFRWIEGFIHGFNDLKSYGYEEIWGDKEFWSEGIAAFTVVELGNLLWRKASPDEILRAYGVVFNVPDTSFITPEGLSQCMENPDIGAKMLVYLLENNLITI